MVVSVVKRTSSFNTSTQDASHSEEPPAPIKSCSAGVQRGSIVTKSMFAAKLHQPVPNTSQATQFTPHISPRVVSDSHSAKPRRRATLPARTTPVPRVFSPPRVIDYNRYDPFTVKPSPKTNPNKAPTRRRRLSGDYDSEASEFVPSSPTTSPAKAPPKRRPSAAKKLDAAMSSKPMAATSKPKASRNLEVQDSASEVRAKAQLTAHVNNASSVTLGKRKRSGRENLDSVDSSSRADTDYDEVPSAPKRVHLGSSRSQDAKRRNSMPAHITAEQGIKADTTLADIKNLAKHVGNSLKPDVAPKLRSSLPTMNASRLVRRLTVEVVLPSLRRSISKLPQPKSPDPLDCIL
ncbi:hypothetical protein BKA62DRAFT_673543 [Auriculariales sp. MPI-PUGE-AT-0066]|nr:hypothetical protein BKA62DRAFT_673543 [Auriculariales sp. MPI-PUGE-AT-0066]